MKPEEFAKNISSGALRPVYYLYGDEPYLMERAVKQLIARLVAPDFRDFNLNIYYGNECRGEEIAETSQTLPFFADRRVVIVKRGDALSALAMETLLPYLQNPSPSTCLVFQGGKIDQRKKFFVELKKTGELVEYKPPYENQLGTFIRDEATGHGKKLEPAAVELLVYLTGINLQELASQVEKAVTYVGERDTIRLADIKTIASDTRADSVFDLTNAVGEKNLVKALRTFATMIRDGEAPLMILAMLTRHFRQLWQVREQLDKRSSTQDIGKATGINPYFLAGTIAQARNYQIAELQGIFERLFETDLALKSGGDELVVERLLMEICGNSSAKKAKV